MNYANEFEGETKISQSLTKRETGNIDFRNIKKVWPCNERQPSVKFWTSINNNFNWTFLKFVNDWEGDKIIQYILDNSALQQRKTLIANTMKIIQRNVVDKFVTKGSEKSIFCFE